MTTYLSDLVARAQADAEARRQRVSSLLSLLSSPEPDPFTGSVTGSVSPVQVSPTEYVNQSSYDGPLSTFQSVTLQPDALGSLIALAREYDLRKGAGELRGWGNLASFRTYAEQAALGGTPGNPGGSNPNATTAGNSYHERGLAVDLPSWLKTPEFFEMMRQAGWNQLAGEPWHWTYKAYG